MSFKSKRKRAQRIESLLEELKKLKRELQEECDHSKVVATVYPGMGCNDDAPEGICLLCGLREGGLDTGFEKLEGKPTKCVSYLVFDKRFKRGFKLELYLQLHPELYSYLLPMSMINKMKGFNRALPQAYRTKHP